MSTNNLIGHPSLQREFGRLRKLGAKIEIKNGKDVTIYSSVIPPAVVDVYVERIRKLDPDHTLEIRIAHKEPGAK